MFDFIKKWASILFYVVLAPLYFMFRGIKIILELMYKSFNEFIDECIH